MEWIVEAESLSDFVDHGRYTIHTKPFIRCRDCIKLQRDVLADMYWCGGREVPLDHYCGYAERREETKQINSTLDAIEEKIMQLPVEIASPDNFTEPKFHPEDWREIL